MAVALEDDRRRCTDCGRESDALTWFPFTVYACPECAARRRAYAAEEKRTGNVCALCGSPRSLCVC